MWCFSSAIPRDSSRSEEEEIAQARQAYPGATEIFCCDGSVHVYMPAQIQDAGAQLFAARPGLLPGPWLLQWYEPWMKQSVKDLCAAQAKRQEQGPSGGAGLGIRQPPWMKEFLKEMMPGHQQPGSED